MKSFTLLCTLIFTWSLSAQDYHKFIHEDNRWMVSWDLNTTIWDADIFYENVFGADTLINDTLYTIVWLNYYARTGEEGGFETIKQPFEPGDQDELVGFVREDEVNQRVYFRPADTEISDQEFLLYDFNLQVGESIYDDLIGSGPITVTQIDTINIYGAERRVWTFDNGLDVIEGIGSVQGPFEGLTILISGAIPQLYQFCQGPAMDCHVAVDGLVNPRRQITIRYVRAQIEAPWEVEIRSFRFQDTIHWDGQVFWGLGGVPPDPEDGIYYREVGPRVYRYIPAEEDEPSLLFDMEWPDSLLFIFTVDGFMGYSITYGHDGYWPFALSNGEERNSLRLYGIDTGAPWQEMVQWVEGIGDIRNPLFPEHYLSPLFDIGTSELLCFYDDYEEEPIYLNPDFINCAGDPINSTDDLTADAFRLFPNPTTGMVNIDFPVERWQMELFDLFGRKLTSFANSSMIDISTLPAGTYYYHILNVDGLTITTGKLLKQ